MNGWVIIRDEGSWDWEKWKGFSWSNRVMLKCLPWEGRTSLLSIKDNRVSWHRSWSSLLGDCDYTWEAHNSLSSPRTWNIQINFRLEWQAQILTWVTGCASLGREWLRRDYGIGGWKQVSSGTRGIEVDWWEWFLWRGIQHNDQCGSFIPRAMKETFLFCRFKILLKACVFMQQSFFLRKEPYRNFKWKHSISNYRIRQM